MRNSIFPEDHAKDCQEIEELRRICCEEAERARQLKIDELSIQQREYPSTVNQLLVQIQDVQDKVNFLSDARTILKKRAPLEYLTFPTLEYFEERSAAILACHLKHGIQWILQETFSKAFLLEKDRYRRTH